MLFQRENWLSLLMLFEVEPNEVHGLKTNSGKQTLVHSCGWFPQVVGHKHLKLRELWSLINNYGYYIIMASFSYGYIYCGYYSKVYAYYTMRIIPLWSVLNNVFLVFSRSTEMNISTVLRSEQLLSIKCVKIVMLDSKKIVLILKP